MNACSVSLVSYISRAKSKTLPTHYFSQMHFFAVLET